VAILAVWAGTRDPLTLLYLAFAAFVIVAIAFEVLQQPWGRRWIPHFPFDFRITMARKDAQPKPPPVAVERGFLDYEMDAMRGINAANKLLGLIAKELARNTRDTTTSAARLSALKGAPVEKRVRGAKKAADALSAHANRLGRLEMEYRAACHQMTSNFLHWIETAPEGNDFETFDRNLVELAEITKASRASTLAYRNSVHESRQLRVSQDVNGATDRVIAVVDKLVQDVESITKYCVDAHAAIGRRAASRQPATP
jgi:Zn-dependent M32 family carboxypeptidase